MAPPPPAVAPPHKRLTGELSDSSEYSARPGGPAPVLPCAFPVRGGARPPGGTSPPDGAPIGWALAPLKQL